MEHLGVDALLKYKEIAELFPLGMKECHIKTAYSYGPTIGHKLCYYNKILNNIIKKDLKTLTCNCQEKYHDFIYEPHGHVHTGCLDLIQC